ncbi:MAG TPA: hypothetical protein VMS96_01600 [Terriglobales bacterium]|nr:hypothetical protein [Terriglobales bacterium]
MFTTAITKTEYFELRSRYTPKHPKTIFVLESPPASGKYFYNPTGTVREPLFKALMDDVLEVAAQTKEEGLKTFASEGFLVVDATYTPVNDLDDDEADAIILRDFPLLLEDLRAHAGPDTALVLIKANVCELLEPKLKKEDFKVLNNGERIPFPSTGQQTKFRTAIRKVLGLSPDPTR